MIELTWADLCSSGHAAIIWDRRTGRCCPLCAAPSVLHLATVLNRREKKELDHG